VTDDQHWQSPSGVGPPLTPPHVTPPPIGPTPVPPGGLGRPGWTPPPKPGLIPLRPLDLGTILGASFRVLRRNPRPTFGAALLIQGSVYLLLILAVGFVTVGAVSRINASTTQNVDQVTAGAYGLIVLSAVIPGLLAVIASAVLQGVIVLEVSRGAVGEKLTLGQLWRRARGRIGALIGWAALLVLGSSVAVGVLAGLIVLLVATLGVAGVIAAVVLGLLGGLGLAVLYVWLATKLALVPSALMIERLSLRGAVARSWSLTRSFFWRTFGISALVAVIVGVVSQVVSTPLSFVTPMVLGLVDPQGQNGPTAIAIGVALAVLTVIVAVVFQSVTSVVQSATTGLLYLDLRIRKEGLDLELARFVEARQAGDTRVGDPLLHATSILRPVPADESPWA
jgi:MFS family permease